MAEERTIHGTGLEGSLDPKAEASFALMRHRGALAAGNAVEVERTLDLHTWGSGDPGILHRLAKEIGVPAAVSRLQRFWSKAEASIEEVRLVGPEEVEVFEVVTPPGGGRSLRTVALVRRRGGRWRIVTTRSTSDEIIRLCVFGPRGSKPDVLPRDLLQWVGELQVQGTRGMLIQPETGFELQIEAVDGLDARIDATAPEVLSRLADGCAVVMLVGEMPRASEHRAAMMSWASHAAAECAERLGSDAVLLPSCDRILGAAELAAIGPEDVRGAWVSVSEDEELAYSRGLAHVCVPELELVRADWANAAESLGVAVQWALRGELPFEPDSVVDLGGMELYVELGRRGPISSTTYGRWGSRLLRPVR